MSSNERADLQELKQNQTLSSAIAKHFFGTKILFHPDTVTINTVWKLKSSAETQTQQAAVAAPWQQEQRG